MLSISVARSYSQNSMTRNTEVRLFPAATHSNLGAVAKRQS